MKQHGISVFLMPAGMLGTLRSLFDVLPLFSNSAWGEKANLAFLEKHMGTNFKERPRPWSTSINIDDVNSGDFLALSKIRGRWGAFETLEKWVTGAFAGHTAVCLKDESGKLWVGESGHENEKVIVSISASSHFWIDNKGQELGMLSCSAMFVNINNSLYIYGCYAMFAFIFAGGGNYCGYPLGGVVGAAT